MMPCRWPSKCIGRVSPVPVDCGSHGTRIAKSLTRQEHPSHNLHILRRRAAAAVRDPLKCETSYGENWLARWGFGSPDLCQGLGRSQLFTECHPSVDAACHTDADVMRKAIDKTWTIRGNILQKSSNSHLEERKTPINSYLGD